MAGLRDRSKGHAPRTLSEGEEAAFAAAIFCGLDPQTDGVSAWTRPDLCHWLEAHFGKTYDPSSLT